MTKLRNKTLFEDAQRISTVLGGRSSNASSDSIGNHSILLNLSADDHPQYVHTSAARTISAVHAFSPSVTSAPFTLGANAQGQLVTGFNADLLDGQHASAFSASGHVHAHSALTGVGANDHHAQAHVLATGTALGGDHTVSGLTAGQVLRATSATTAAFQSLIAADIPQLAHSGLSGLAGDDHTQYLNNTRHDTTARHTLGTVVPHDALASLTERNHSSLTGIGADDHHPKSHVLATTSALGVDHTVSGLTAGQVLRATSATTAVFQSLIAADIPQLAHSGLSGLAGDDHTQYLTTTRHDTTTRHTLGTVVPHDALASLTERNHSSLTGIGVNDHHAQVHVLATHAALGSDHTVSGLTAGHVLRATSATAAYFQALQDSDLPTTIVRTSRQVIAGAGLTGGGDLSADRTFNVGAGSGITVNADDVALAWGTPTISTITPDVAASAGSGANPARSDHVHAIVTVAPGANSVNLSASSEGTGTSFARADHTHQLDVSIVPTWTGAHTFSATATMRSIVPQLTDTYDLGSSTAIWRQSFISQLNSTVFTEQTNVLLGGWFTVGKDQGTLPAVAAAQTTIDFGKTMTVGHFVVVKAADSTGTIKTEYLQVGALVSGTTYNVTRDLAGIHSPDPIWADGTPYLVLGTTGSGRIELNAYDTPRFSVIKQGATYNAQTELIRIGDLNGMTGVATETYGVYIGDATNYLKYDGSALTIAGNGSGVTNISGSNITTGTINASVVTVTNLNASNITTGSLSASVMQTNVLSAVQAVISNLSAIEADMGSITAGSIVIGTTNKIWLNEATDGALNIGGATKASAPFRVAATGALVATSATITGAITATSGSVGSFTIGTYLYTGTKTAYNDTNAGVHLGSDGIGIGNNVFTVSAAGALVATSATITGAITATSGTIGGFTVNSTEGLYSGTGATRVQMKAGVGFWAGADAQASAPFRVTAAGALVATSADITGTIDANAGHIGALDVDGILTIAAAGEIRQGTGTIGSNYTGLRVWNDTSVGRIAGYNTNVMQWYAGTDGKLYAGGGAIQLDSTGVTVNSSASFVFQYLGSTVGQLQMKGPGDNTAAYTLQVEGYRTSVNSSAVALVARTNAGANQASVIVEQGSNVGGVRVLIDSQEYMALGTSAILLKKGTTVWNGLNIGSSTSGAADGQAKISGQFISTLATGTAPFSVVSTTVVPNLNVDTVDGYHLNQDVRTVGSPTFGGLLVSGTSSINALTVTNGLTVSSGGVNLGSATGAAAGDLFASGWIGFNSTYYFKLESTGGAIQNSKLVRFQGAAADAGFGTMVTGDTYSRWKVVSDGSMWWGEGAGGQDLQLKRETGSVGASFYLTGTGTVYGLSARGTSTMNANVADGYVGNIGGVAVYNGAYTVTRHNYMNFPNVTGTSTITAAALVRFDANVGTHKALAANGTVATTLGSTGPTGSTAGAPQGWVRINVNGTLRHIPFW